MSGLVGYASSDEEDDIQPERPAKIAKTGAYEASTTSIAANRRKLLDGQGLHSADYKEAQPPATTIQKPRPQPSTPAQEETLPPNPTPAPGPSAPGPSTHPEPPPDPTNGDAPSPYTLERSLLRNLTMPTHPNFSIPSSPSPPPQNSEAALALSTTTKKFDRFLELKKQGVHFNERLEGSVSLRNLGLLGKLREFAGVGEEDSYASTLVVEEGGVPVVWPEEWYVENLVKENERREKRGRKERGEVEFVKAKEGGKSAASSKASTPKGGSEHRKTKFERR